MTYPMPSTVSDSESSPQRTAALTLQPATHRRANTLPQAPAKIHRRSTRMLIYQQAQWLVIKSLMTPKTSPEPPLHTLASPKV